MPTGPETGGAWVGFSTIELPRLARPSMIRPNQRMVSDQPIWIASSGRPMYLPRNELEAFADAEGALAGRDSSDAQGDLDLLGGAVRMEDADRHGLAGERPELLDGVGPS